MPTLDDPLWVQSPGLGVVGFKGSLTTCASVDAHWVYSALDDLDLIDAPSEMDTQRIVVVRGVSNIVGLDSLPPDAKRGAELAGDDLIAVFLQSQFPSGQEEVDEPAQITKAFVLARPSIDSRVALIVYLWAEESTHADLTDVISRLLMWSRLRHELARNGYMALIGTIRDDRFRSGVLGAGIARPLMSTLREKGLVK